MSIEEVLLEIESRRFVGRHRELTALRELLDRAPAEATVAYVYGPSGVGKTALLQAVARSARQRGLVPVSLGLRRSGASADAALRQLAGVLGIPREKPCGVEDCCAALQSLADRGGALLLLDDYDALEGEEGRLREGLLYRLPRGVAAVLTGRRSPVSVWPLERAWRHFLTQIPLTGLLPEDADRLFVSQGIEDRRVRREAYLLTGGRPSLLAHVADLLAAGETAATLDAGPVAAAAPQQDVSTYLLEQIVHPGSRRGAWRPRAGEDGTDAALAAASLVPAYSREMLAAMIGQPIEETAWESLGRLPCTAEPGGFQRLEESLRHRVSEIVLRQRPWLSELWLRRAARYVLSQDAGRAARMRGDLTLEIVLRMAGAGTGPWPFAVGGRHWRRSRGAGPDEISRLCAGCEAEPVARLALARREQAQVVRDGRGQPLAVAVAIAAADCPANLWPARRWSDREVVLCLAACDQAAASFALCGVAGAFEHASAVTAVGSSAGVEALAGVGFVRQSAAPDVWRLELSVRTFSQWLHALAGPRLAPTSTGDPGALAKEVLQALAGGQDLRETEAAAVFGARRGEGTADAVREWILDALESADLGEAPCSLRALLHLYYVQKAGPHEEIAEHLDLPRATYFRAYRQALMQYGLALCGASV